MKKHQFTEEAIIKIFQEGRKGDKPIDVLCREHGCSVGSYYGWKQKYGDSTPDDTKRLRRLEKENASMLRIIAKQSLEIDAMREVLKKSNHDR